MKIAKLAKLAGVTLAAALAAVVTVPSVADAGTPLAGVPTKIRRGFFTETDLGAFFTLTGQGANPSNAQAYLALALGYDVFSSGDHHVSLGASFSMGTSAGACFGTTYDPNATASPCRGSSVDPDTQETVVLSDNWTITTFEGSALYGFQIVPRLMLTLRGLGGAGIVQPQAFDGVENPVPLAGGGLGLEYATQFDHFSLGLDLAGKYFIGPNVPAVAIAPRVKYTF